MWTADPTQWRSGNDGYHHDVRLSEIVLKSYFKSPAKIAPGSISLDGNVDSV